MCFAGNLNLENSPRKVQTTADGRHGAFGQLLLEEADYGRERAGTRGQQCGSVTSRCVGPG